jgi:hypothetical protein
MSMKKMLLLILKSDLLLYEKRSIDHSLPRKYYLTMSTESFFEIFFAYKSFTNFFFWESVEIISKYIEGTQNCIATQYELSKFLINKI